MTGRLILATDQASRPRRGRPFSYSFCPLLRDPRRPWPDTHWHIALGPWSPLPPWSSWIRTHRRSDPTSQESMPSGPAASTARCGASPPFPLRLLPLILARAASFLVSPLLCRSPTPASACPSLLCLGADIARFVRAQPPELCAAPASGSVIPFSGNRELVGNTRNRHVGSRRGHVQTG